MDERVTQLEAEAEASAELGALPEASLESQFKALAAGSSVDAELDALKQKMALGTGSSGPQKAIGASDEDEFDAGPEMDMPDMGDMPVQNDLRAAEVDAQLEELKRKLSSS
jgi:phage shock protein A